jgi:hypothetical protein
MACSIVETSTEERGLKSVILLLETDMRLVLTLECVERPEKMDAEGDLERGVDMSELEML